MRRSDGRKRRRSQTAMYHIADALIVLLSPILVHSADEAYRSLKNEEAGYRKQCPSLRNAEDGLKIETDATGIM